MATQTIKVTKQDDQAASSRRSRKRKWLGRLAPGAFAGALFLLNNLGVIHGIVAAPRGYAPLGVQRNMDLAQYLTWLAGLKSGWSLQNYHAPWITPPGLIVPGLFPVAVLERWFSLPPVFALQLFSFGGYVATAYAVAFAYRTFLQKRRQAVRALLLSVACVPLAALPGVFKLFKNVTWTWPWLGNSGGVSEYVTFSDGLLRGLIMAPFIAYGVAGQVLAMALLARYCCSHEVHWFRWLVVVCCVAPLIHPFEIFVTVPVVAIVLLHESAPITEKLKNIAMVVAASAAGLAPHVIQSMRVPWVHDAMNENRPDLRIAPAYLLAGLGLPAILVVMFFLFGLPKNQGREVLVLKTWFLVTVLMFYVPGMPLSLHLLDGVLFSVGMLLTIQIEELTERWPALRHPVVRIAAAMLVVWMIAPQAIFRARSWKDGTALSNIKFASAIAPNDEFATRDWLREHAGASDLVLANYEIAPWLATAPVHAVGGHWLFSAAGIGYKLDPLRAAFFNGTLTPEKAHDFLNTLGARFVVVPDESEASSYLKNAVVRSHFGSMTIYELPGEQMKQYGDPGILELGR